MSFSENTLISAYFWQRFHYDKWYSLRVLLFEVSPKYFLEVINDSLSVYILFHVPSVLSTRLSTLLSVQLFIGFSLQQFGYCLFTVFNGSYGGLYLSRQKYRSLLLFIFGAKNNWLSLLLIFYLLSSFLHLWFIFFFFSKQCTLSTTFPVTLSKGKKFYG